MTEEAIIIKIQKVLALANNNPSAEEGQTAMLLAQKLMVENNISISDVSVTEIKQKEVVSQSIEETQKLAWWHQPLAAIIAKNFKCSVYYNRRRSIGITSIKFVGFKNDIELAKQVYLYAVEVLTYNYKKYVKANSNREFTKGMKNQYIIGFLEGLKDKFEEQVKNNSWGLVVVKDPLVDQFYENLNIKKGGRKTIHTNGNDQDKRNGYKDGKSFQHISGKLE